MYRLVVPLLGAALVVGACSPGPESAEEAETPLRVFGVYRGAEADAFRSVLSAFTNRTGIEVSYVGSSGFAQNIQERVREGDPPDVALFPQPAVMAELAEDGLLVPLADEVAEVVSRNYRPEQAQLGTVDDVLYGAWFRLSVKSLVWYRPDVFAERGYTIPSSWEELRALESRIRADGATPWCFGLEAFAATGWAGTDWIEDLVLRMHGAAVYDDWVAGAVPFTDDRIRSAFEAFSDVLLTPGQVAGGARSILAVPALEAIDQTFDDPPDCLLTRQASFQESALPSGTEIGPRGDIDVFPLPSMEDGPPPLLASGEIAAAFTDSAEAMALVQFLATPDAGEVWAEIGGYNSPHVDFDTESHGLELDARLAELVLASDVIRFDGSDLMPPSVGTGTFWQGVIDYVAGVPLDTVLDTIQSGYPTDSS